LKKVLSAPPVPAGSNVATRVESFTQNADLSWVVTLLEERRDGILERWLTAASDQPFHHTRPERAISDDIPALFDALARLLSSGSDRERNAGVPLEDPDVLTAAQRHARVRFEQGLVGPEIATEFRLLRQEIGRAIRRHVPDAAPTSDVVGAELLLHDALDGAVFLALTELNEHEIGRRRAEADLEAERANDASEREAFFATLGHDLKSPLASASAIAQLLHHQVSKGRLDPEQLGGGLSSIEAALRRGVLRIDELMDLARRDAAEAARPSAAPLDLVALVGGVLDGYRITNGNHEFVLIQEGPVVSAGWDHDRIERVVDNLVSNAVKYSPEGGRISAAVAEEHVGGSPVAVVTVTDQGIGIPERDRETIFARFQRGSNVGAVPGSGIGLWSVRRIVERYGGTLDLGSGTDEGSTFRLRLPMAL